MKLVLGTMFAVLLAGSAAYAQEPDKDKPKEEPQKHEEPRKGEQPARGKQDEPKEKPRQEPDRRPDEHAKPAQQNDRAQQQQQEERNRNQQRSRQQQPLARTTARATDGTAPRQRSAATTAVMAVACRKRNFAPALAAPTTFTCSATMTGASIMAATTSRTPMHGLVTGITTTMCTSMKSMASIT